MQHIRGSLMAQEPTYNGTNSLCEVWSTPRTVLSPALGKLHSADAAATKSGLEARSRDIPAGSRSKLDQSKLP